MSAAVLWYARVLRFPSQRPSEHRAVTSRGGRGYRGGAEGAIGPHLLDRLEQGHRECSDAALEVGILGGAERPSLPRFGVKKMPIRGWHNPLWRHRADRESASGAPDASQILGDKRYGGSSFSATQVDALGYAPALRPSPMAWRRLASIILMLVRTYGRVKAHAEEAAYALENGKAGAVGGTGLIRRSESRTCLSGEGSQCAWSRSALKPRDAVPFLEAALGDEDNDQHTLLALEKREGKGSKIAADCDP